MSGPGWPTAREMMAFAVVALFAYAYIQNPTDQTIVGALIAAFAGAWGFYLGGSKVGTDTAEKNAATVTARAAAVPAPPSPEALAQRQETVPPAPHSV